ncbi:MAG: hypothetical protein DRP06_01630 [Candidatus Aenigmatarchaeota archaeon]|nr:MAG: hypothetical protein DRP06_01630 [Candidatus Aenigmarchaeota archaeon]
MIPKSLLFSFIFFSLLLPITFGEILEIEPETFNLTMNLSSSEDFSFRIVHSNESINLSTPIDIYYKGIIPVYFDKNNFTLITSQNIFVNTSVNSNLFRADNYKGMIFVHTQNETYELPVYINILPTTLYELENNATNMSLDQGDVGVFYLNVSNKGNTEILLPIQKPETEIIFNVPETVIIPVGMNLSIPVFYKIPANFSSGIHELTFFVGEKSYFLNLTVIDKISPEISFDENLPKELYVFNTINFEDYITCSDNENVSSFVYKIGNETRNITDSFYFDKIDSYEFNFVCIDNYANEVQTTKKIDIIPVEIKNLKTEIKIPKKKKGELINLKLFTTSSKLKTKIKIVDFNSTGDMNLVIKSGDKSMYLEPNLNNSLEFTTDGDVILQLSDFENEGNYKGVITFDYGGYIDVNNFKIKFEGEIGDYSVRDPFNLSVYDSVLNCRGVDLGTGSKVVCDGLEFPSDIDQDTYFIPRTQNQMEIQEKLCQERVDNEIVHTNFYKYILWVLGVIILIIVVVFFLIKAKASYHD